MLADGVDRAVDQLGIDEWPHRIVDQHDIGRVVGQRLQARAARNPAGSAPP